MSEFRDHADSDDFAASAQTVRSLSPALRAWALRRFAPALRIWVLVIVGVANMLGGVMFLAAYFGADWPAPPAPAKPSPAIEQARDSLRATLRRPGLAADDRSKLAAALAALNADRAGASSEGAPIGLLWGGIGWIALDLAVVGGIYLLAKMHGARKGRQLLALLEHGRIGDAEVLSNLVDYSTEVNGAPRRIVRLSIDGHPMEMRTFDNNFANLFSEGDLVEVLYDSNIPGMVFPTSQIPAI